MKKIVATLLIIFAANQTITAQQNQNQKKVELFASIDVNRFQSIGASFSFHPLITPAFSIGAGLDIAQIRDNNFNFTPYYLDARYFIRGKKLNVILFVQGSPGSVLNEQERSQFGNTIVLERKNSSFLGSGTGISLAPESAKVKPFLLCKFRRYQMKDENILLNTTRKYTQDQFSLSMGINF